MPCAPVALLWASLAKALALVFYTPVFLVSPGLQEEKALVCLSLAHEVLASAELLSQVSGASCVSF